MIQPVVDLIFPHTHLPLIFTQPMFELQLEQNENYLFESISSTTHEVGHDFTTRTRPHEQEHLTVLLDQWEFMNLNHGYGKFLLVNPWHFGKGTLPRIHDLFP